MKRGQGTLEYLILLAAVLAIAAVVVFMITRAGAGAKTSASIAACKQAASQCATDKFSNPSATCDYCEDACIDPMTGQEVGPNALQACKEGKPYLVGVVTMVPVAEATACNTLVNHCQCHGYAKSTASQTKVLRANITITQEWAFGNFNNLDDCNDTKSQVENALTGNAQCDLSCKQVGGNYALVFHCTGTCYNAANCYLNFSVSQQTIEISTTTQSSAALASSVWPCKCWTTVLDQTDYDEDRDYSDSCPW